ncbi:glucosidase 2 subunit beta isoform X1 [Andrographis paniculata]|uniref:glucosidase 2 subunit beta isoform X1 n=1 Tax=Andrographis paniculata TaxID=175694 RepID=UPI0021E9686C|nr:glucosidase 2 subunit beta isoform X1 [Andrographis paniculata]XP_051151779.1 glucosidase 2 subunit beta isoform X1 [Andrographis paniculata]
MILLPICEGIEAAMSLAVMIACLCFSASWINLSYSSPSRLPVGAHPRDEKYYEAEIIKCKDGSKSFTRDRLNDNFCDCVDGSDEPGTSACPSGTFYCRTMGSKPKFLFSSRVNDQFCDCCDGSDEYDGTVMCPNTCVMDGGILDGEINYEGLNTKTGVRMENLTQKLRGLKTMVYLQVTVVIFVLACGLNFCCKTRKKIKMKSLFCKIHHW